MCWINLWRVRTLWDEGADQWARTSFVSQDQVLVGMCVVHSLLRRCNGFNSHRRGSLTKEHTPQCCGASQDASAHTDPTAGGFSIRALAGDLCAGPDRCVTAGQIRVSALRSHSFCTPAVGGTASNPPFPASPHCAETQWLPCNFWRVDVLYKCRMSQGGGGERQKWRFKCWCVVPDFFACGWHTCRPGVLPERREGLVNSSVVEWIHGWTNEWKQDVLTTT